MILDWHSRQIGLKNRQEISKGQLGHILWVRDRTRANAENMRVIVPTSEGATHFEIPGER